MAPCCLSLLCSHAALYLLPLVHKVVQTTFVLHHFLLNVLDVTMIVALLGLVVVLLRDHLCAAYLMHLTIVRRLKHTACSQKHKVCSTTMVAEEDKQFTQVSFSIGRHLPAPSACLCMCESGSITNRQAVQELPQQLFLLSCQ